MRGIIKYLIGVWVCWVSATLVAIGSRLDRIEGKSIILTKKIDLIAPALAGPPGLEKGDEKNESSPEKRIPGKK